MGTERYIQRFKKHTLPFIMAAICNRSQSFHQYLVDWDQYIQKNNLTDWFDDEPDLKADGFEIVVKKIRTKKTKTPCFRGKLYKWIESSSGGFGFIMPESAANELSQRLTAN